LVTIAHNKSIDVLRHAQRRPRPAEMPEIPVEDSLPAEPDETLRAALDGLSPKQRSAVIYRYLADLSYRDIGQLLECSEAAARRSAADGIAALRSRITKGQLA
jgi:RNA polymerase sigma factor (sigma-70 family)